jgi:hypothetical protein
VEGPGAGQAQRSLRNEKHETTLHDRTPATHSLRAYSLRPQLYRWPRIPIEIRRAPHRGAMIRSPADCLQWAPRGGALLPLAKTPLEISRATWHTHTQPWELRRDTGECIRWAGLLTCLRRGPFFLPRTKELVLKNSFCGPSSVLFACGQALARRAVPASSRRATASDREFSCGRARHHGGSSIAAGRRSTGCRSSETDSPQGFSLF